MPCSKCGTTGHNARTCTWKPKKNKNKRDIKDCCVCYEELETGNGIVTTNCGHNYCASCFANWMRKSGSCAYCREEICEKPQTQLLMTEEQEEQIIDELLINDEVAEAIVSDLKNQCMRVIKEKNMDRGYCHPLDMISILDEINFVFPICIIGRGVLEMAATSTN